MHPVGILHPEMIEHGMCPDAAGLRLDEQQGTGAP
jgi:hypothetical protein